MFHTYVLAASGKMVDFDRASFLMDKDLFDASIRAMRKARAEPPDPFDLETAHRMGSEYRFNAAQWVWGYYCQRHVEEYGEYFVPDVDPTWDQPTPLPEPEAAVTASQYSDDDLDPASIRVLGRPEEDPH